MRSTKSYCQMSTMSSFNWIFVLIWQQKRQPRKKMNRNLAIEFCMHFAFWILVWRCEPFISLPLTTILSDSVYCVLYGFLWKQFAFLYVWVWSIFVLYAELNVYLPYPIFHFVCMYVYSMCNWFTVLHAKMAWHYLNGYGTMEMEELMVVKNARRLCRK